MIQEDDDLHRFGTPLQPLEEDVPAKKPVSVHDQIVTDENGKRRFHGAFTGGFSAGFWNTVGSKEGWTPQTFKSSRNERATQKQLRPEDFMDDEDKGEFGIAPQRLEVRDDFAKESEGSKKRKLYQPSTGPIPGAPVLQQLIRPVHDKVAVRILKSMGWRPGQGIGPRQTKSEKKAARERSRREIYLMEQYGYQPKTETATLHKPFKGSANESESDTESDEDENITFAPDDFEPFFVNTKENRYGIGYTPLSRDPVLSKGATATPKEHINFFEPLMMIDKNNKKISITGKGFGVGALEEEDDDIYERDDLTKYDFSLDERKARKEVSNKPKDSTIIPGFVAATKKTQHIPQCKVNVPDDWEPRNWAERKSRFAPLDLQIARKLQRNTQNTNTDLNPEKRGELLGEQSGSTTSLKTTPSIQNEEIQPAPRTSQNPFKSKADRTKELLDRISSKSASFTRGGIITAEGEEKLEIKEGSNSKDEASSLASISQGDPSSFKPFLYDPAKQTRYEEFLNANLRSEEEIGNFLNALQPFNMSEWDREMEKKEFIQSRKIYKPLDGLMSERFVTESAVETKKTTEEFKTDAPKKLIVQRTVTTWKPCSSLCKRFNIPEPFGGTMLENEPAQQKPKISVFDYLECSVNTKSSFQTPIIIPKKIENPKPIVAPAKETLLTPSKPTVPDTQITPKMIFGDSEAKPSTSTEEDKQVKTKEFVPRTNIEKMCVESLHKPAEEKMELFKAIFDDSDEEDENKTMHADNDQVNEAASIESLLPSVAKPTTAAALNLLRNTSPPRGIFAALFTSKSLPKTEEQQQEVQVSAAPSDAEMKSQLVPDSAHKITFKKRSERMQDVIEEPMETYGPALPAQLRNLSSTEGAREKNANTVDGAAKLLEKQKPCASSNFVAEGWVERIVLSSEDDDDDDDDSSSSSSESDKSIRKKSKKSKKHKSKERHKKHSKKHKKKANKHTKSHKGKKIKKKY